MSQSTTASPVEAAKAEVNRLFELERSLTEKRSAKAAEIQAVQQDAAQSASDEASIEQLATRAIRAQFELRATEQSIELTRQRRLAAIRDRFKVEAEALRSQAAELRSQADGIRKKCLPLWLSCARLRTFPSGRCSSGQSPQRTRLAILQSQCGGSWANPSRNTRRRRQIRSPTCGSRSSCRSQPGCCWKRRALSEEPSIWRQGQCSRTARSSETA